MPRLVAKKKGNKLYYYVVESARVEGKPRIVHQAYLGTAEKLAEMVRPHPPGRLHPRIWLARRPMGGCPAHRSVGLAGFSLAHATLRPFARALPGAGRFALPLPARS